MFEPNKEIVIEIEMKFGLIMMNLRYFDLVQIFETPKVTFSDKYKD